MYVLMDLQLATPLLPPTPLLVSLLQRRRRPRFIDVAGGRHDVQRELRDQAVAVREKPGAPQQHGAKGLAWEMVGRTQGITIGPGKPNNEHLSWKNMKIWRFPRMGVPPNHPLWIYKIFHYKPSISGYEYLPHQETSIWSYGSYGI